MPLVQSNAAARALNRAHRPPILGDRQEPRALNRLHAAPARVIEIGEVTAGIAVPEDGGVRFFASDRDFDPLDGAVFRSVEQAAKAARDRFRAVTRPARRNGRLAPERRAV